VNTIAVTVNDQPRSVAADWTVHSLAQSLGLAERKGVAKVEQPAAAGGG